jgi:exonuclease VII large subunit
MPSPIRLNHKENKSMATHFKGQRITELLEMVARTEQQLEIIRERLDGSGSNEELARGYTTVAIAKAKLMALLGNGLNKGKEDECGK